MLEIVEFTLGPVQTNAYLVADPQARVAAVIDPAWNGAAIVREAEQRGWTITDIWLTHAHFDHFGGAGGVADGVDPAPVGSSWGYFLPLYGDAAVMAKPGQLSTSPGFSRRTGRGACR